MKKILTLAIITVALFAFKYLPDRNVLAQSGTGPGVSATNEDGQTFSSGVNILSFTENIWDTGNIHLITGDLTKFVAPTSGFYLASVSAMINTNGVGFQLFYRVNGVDVDGAGVSQGTASGNMNTACHYSAILKLNAGDYVQAYSYFTGTATTVPYYSTMQLTKLSSTF